jgi:hypothetical protein
MIQTESTRMNAEDKRELERNIKELKTKIEVLDYHRNEVAREEADRCNKELRRLRRLR